MIEFENGTIHIGAEDIAAGLCLTPDMVMQGLRDGTITSVCEKGMDVDAGRHRLTFFSRERRLRLIVDATGAILKQSAVDHLRRVSGDAPGNAPGDASGRAAVRTPERPARPEPAQAVK